MNYDIILTRDELRALRKVHRKGSVPKEDIYHFRYLLDSGFLEDTGSNDLGYLGFPNLTGKFKTTDFYARFCIYHRCAFFWRYFTPITISAITTTVLYILEHLFLPGLTSFLSGLF